MTGSALMDFLIGVILLVATGVIFFLVIDRIAPDALFNRIGKIAVGVVLLIVFLVAIKAVLFGGAGGLHLDPKGFFEFCIGVLVILVVLIIIEYGIGWLGGAMAGPRPPGSAAPAATGLTLLAKQVVFALALIALLVVAERTLLGGGFTNSFGNLLEQPRR